MAYVSRKDLKEIFNKSATTVMIFKVAVCERPVEKLKSLLDEYNISLENYFDCSIAKYLVDGVPATELSDIFYEENVEFVAEKSTA